MVDAITLLGGTSRLGEAYCLRACLAAWHVAGHAIGCVPSIDDAHGVEDTGGTAKAWVRTDDSHRISVRDALDDPSLLEIGDIMIRVRDPDHRDAVLDSGRTVPGHAEIVYGVHPSPLGGRLSTAGGNTISTDGATGNGFFRHPLGIALDDPRIVGFLRPAMTRL